jgi:hypothetical protein
MPGAALASVREAALPFTTSARVAGFRPGRWPLSSSPSRRDIAAELRHGEPLQQHCTLRDAACQLRASWAPKECDKQEIEAVASLMATGWMWDLGNAERFRS